MNIAELRKNITENSRNAWKEGLALGKASEYNTLAVGHVARREYAEKSVTDVVRQALEAGYVFKSSTVLDHLVQPIASVEAISSQWDQKMKAGRARRKAAIAAKKEAAKAKVAAIAAIEAAKAKAA